MSNSVKKSVQKQKTVHGVVVRRLPIGDYLAAVESIREFPENILNRLFPDLSIEEAFLHLKHLRTDTLLKIVGRGASAVPDELLGFFSTLLGIPVEMLRDEMTPSEFADVLYEFWRINDLSNFFQRVKGVVSVLR